jgi:hypothetical protein
MRFKVSFTSFCHFFTCLFLFLVLIPPSFRFFVLHFSYFSIFITSLGWSEDDDSIITENKVFFRTQTNDSSSVDIDDSLNNEPGNMKCQRLTGSECRTFIC